MGTVKTRLGRLPPRRGAVLAGALALLGALLLGAGVQPSLAVGSPNITTTASPSTEVGLQIFDNANLQGGENPTGTIVFSLFGPGDEACANRIFTSNVTVSGNGSYNSQRFTTSQAGTYRWQARYSGDPNNNPAGPTACSDPAETVVVSKASTVLNTTGSGPAGLGAPIHDTAVLAGGLNPTGTISFFLYAPDDQFCSGTPLFTSTVPVNGNGTYVSGDFTPAAPGVYKWRASYSGDVNNLGVSLTSCLEPSEASTVTAASGLTITTTASAATTVGGQVSDTATLSGGTSPTGTITFRLYGPNDATCAGTPAFQSAKPVSGNGTVQSDPFTVTQAGTYHWVAAYGGDANNPAITTPCNDPAEAVVVSPGTTTTSTTSTTSTSTTAPPTSTTSPSTTSPSTTSPPATTTTAPATTTTVPPVTTTTAAPATTTTVPSGMTTTAAPGATTTVPPATTTTVPPAATTTVPPGTTTTAAPGTPTTSTTSTTGAGPTTTSLGTTTTVAAAPGAPSVSISPSTVPAGQNATVTGTNLPPGPVDVTLFSTPVVLARPTVGAAGTFSVVVTIPADTEPGAHRLVVGRPDGTPLAETTVTATPPASQMVAQTAGPVTRQLSRTGADASEPAGMAAAMVAAGLLLLAATRRRSLAGAWAIPAAVPAPLRRRQRHRRRRRYPWD